MYSGEGAEMSESEATAQPQRKIEMNTYVQLEVDSNNHACIPRVCRFSVAKLSLFSDSHSPVLLAVKLDVSKRSLRTVEFPLALESSSKSATAAAFSASFNLQYSLIYPHFLKKDVNLLYFYVQKKNKYKNRTMLGYKTLAFSYIDLSSILQKPFSDELPLFCSSNASKEETRQLVGSLRIHSLISLPVECFDFEASFQMAQHEADEEETRDESLAIGAAAVGEAEPKEKELDKGAKNFTGKILSFIKKLGRTEEQPEGEEPIHDEFEDFDDIEQVSDFDESSADIEDDTDVYSIISTPKPKFQPFFTNSNPDLSRLDNGSNKSCDFPCLTGATSFKSLRKNRSTGSMEIPSGGVLVALERHIEESFLHSDRPPINLFIVRPGDPLIHAACLHSISNERALFIDPLELPSIFDLCLKWEPSFAAKNAVVKVILVGNDSFFSEYLKIYVQHLRGENSVASILKHYLIPRESSMLGKALAEHEPAYNCLFADKFWCELDDEAGKRDLAEVWKRIRGYIESADAKPRCFQIGEVLVNNQLNSVLIPFICSVKVSGMSEEIVRAPNRVSLSSSKSVPQFVNLASCGLKPASKEDGSLVESHYNPTTATTSALGNDDETNALNLKLDFWKIVRFSNSASSSGFSRASKSNDNFGIKKLNKINKFSIRGAFKSLQIQRWAADSGQDSSSANASRVPFDYLSMTYLIREKKQKIMRLSSKKSKEATNQKETKNLIRLVCMPQECALPFTLSVDGVKMPGVSSFQVSSDWQGKLKQIYLALP